MNDKLLENLLKFIISHYITQKQKRRGNRRIVRTSIHLPKERAQDMLLFLTAQGKSDEEAVRLLRSACRKIRQSGILKLPNLFLANIMPFLLMGIFTFAVLDDAMPLSTFLFSYIFLFFISFLFFTPRERGMEQIWQENNMQDKPSILSDIPLLAEAYEAPILGLLLRKIPVRTVIFLFVPVIVFFYVVGSEGVEWQIAVRYQRTMTSGADLLDLRGSDGTRYVVYDTGEEAYVPKYLDPSLRAETPEDVRGVFVVTWGAQQVGTYVNSYNSKRGTDVRTDILPPSSPLLSSNKSRSNAYQYIAIISLYDCRSGRELFLTRSVYGADPPERVSPSSYATDHYGKKPTDEQIGEACESLISLLAR